MDRVVVARELVKIARELVGIEGVGLSAETLKANTDAIKDIMERDARKWGCSIKDERKKDYSVLTVLDPKGNHFITVIVEYYGSGYTVEVWGNPDKYRKNGKMLDVVMLRAEIPVAEVPERFKVSWAYLKNSPKFKEDMTLLESTGTIIAAGARGSF